MATGAQISQKVDRIVGPLPPNGRIPANEPYPFETVTPSRDGFVDRGGMKIYFAQFGTAGPTIVFAPIYSIVHMGMLKGTVPYLAQHFRVVAIDMRGNGRSDRPTDPAAYTFDQCYADLILSLIHI